VPQSETKFQVGFLDPFIAKMRLHGELTERDVTTIGDVPYTLVD